MIRLDLCAFLHAQEGYVLDAAESTRDSLKMRSGSQVLIVRCREDGVWGYFNPHDPADNGTIIQYLQRRRGSGFTLGHVKRHLRGFVPRAEHSPMPSPRPQAPRDLMPVAARWQRAQRLTGLPPYLAARGLTEATVTAYAAALRTDHRGNVLFAHTDEAGAVVGYEIAGPALHSFSKGGTRLLCRLGPLDGPEPVKIALTESGIDALSLAQLTGRRDTLFLSTGGALSRHTLDQVERLAERYPAAQILPAFDADAGGKAFADQVEQTFAGRNGIRRIVPKGGCKDWNDQLRGKLMGPSVG